VCFLILLQNLDAQKTCISGDCVNGAGKILKANGDTIIGVYKNGKLINELFVAGKNHLTYNLASLETNRWFLNKRGDSLNIGIGVIAGSTVKKDISNGLYLFTKRGDAFLEKNNAKISFEVDKPIKATIFNIGQQTSTVEFISNGADYVLYNFILGKATNGIAFINSTKRYIYFDIINNNVVLNNAADKNSVQQKIASINNFSLGGFDELYFNNFTNQRTINELESYVTKLKTTLIKPIDDCMKLLETAYLEFQRISQNPIIKKQPIKQKPIVSLTHEEWNELFKKELMETCKSEYPEQYQAFLDDESLVGLPSRDKEVVYNITRDENNFIALADFSNNNKLPFLIPAFKITFAYLLKKNFYIVPSAKAKHFDINTNKYFDFRVRL
jgi:hypothetical protein